MTDLHTHILPGMDDGAKDVETSLDMLRAQREQGVDAVILTPHFYRRREHADHFLKRRRAAAQHLADALMALPQDEARTLPRLALGAEVAWFPNMADCQELEFLTLGTSRTFLLELPFQPWTDQMISQLYELPARTGLTPILAHLERYTKGQRKAHMEAVMRLGFPVQISAAPMLHSLQRGALLKMLREGRAQYVASDSHSRSARPPNLGAAMTVVRRKLGGDMADSLIRRSDELFGEALNRPQK